MSLGKFTVRLLYGVSINGNERIVRELRREGFVLGLQENTDTVNLHSEKKVKLKLTLNLFFKLTPGMGLSTGFVFLIFGQGGGGG